MEFNALDYGLMAVVVISTLISLWRGFTKEILSLLLLVASLWIMLRFSPALAGLLEPLISSSKVRLGVACIILLVLTLITATLVVRLLLSLVSSAGLTVYDRLLGSLFGAARGVLLIMLLIILADLTKLPQQALWQKSVLIPHVEKASNWMRSRLPNNLSGFFDQ